MAKTVRTPIGADTTRSIRKGIFDSRDRMSFKKDPTKHRIWVNDVDGELDRYLEGGFTFVEKDYIDEGHIENGTQMDRRVSINVGRAGTGENVQAYLVEMPIEEWQQIKEEIKEEREAPLREIGNTAKQMSRTPGFYGPGMNSKLGTEKDT